ncbi:conserved hypothetical protein [Candidatus Caldarchaeum subterraneum]|uniref:DUF1116 domain-containing protein n=1 Tax=Caldiarchaeum subterraneum TaxID=311458 RepID=E6N5L0_CALS0|nr:conserved hypothetical protein [Candidatus Caldarchaeum subterraneum]BAJ50375.1 conserved hypothetical protein [Candidatus Caldarchaeum subterraneum]
MKEEIERANQKTLELMMETKPVLTDLVEARKSIQFLRKDYHLTHAGPPISWERASGPLRGAIIGAALYEGWADNEQRAIRLAETGEIVLEPNHHHSAVGPMAGVISPSMKVFVVSDGEVKAFSNLNEGLGKVLRYGAYSEDVLKKLKYLNGPFADVLADAIRDAVKEKGGIDLRNIIAQAVHMGDECHNRNIAATSLFFREITSHVVKVADTKTAQEVLTTINANNLFFLNLAMASCKLMTDKAHNIKYSTIVTTISRNGTDLGIRVSGLGDEWFTAPAPVPKGLYFPGFTENDSNPDIGDSTITETAGLGAAAMAASPAIVKFVGGDVKLALEITNRMARICYGRHRYFTIPYLEFEGTPVGVDIRRVLRLGLPPVADTGIAHKNAGVGQVGAGIVEIPIEPFKQALRKYAERYGV